MLQIPVASGRCGHLSGLPTAVETSSAALRQGSLQGTQSSPCSPFGFAAVFSKAVSLSHTGVTEDPGTLGMASKLLVRTRAPTGSPVSQLAFDTVRATVTLAVGFQACLFLPSHTYQMTT